MKVAMITTDDRASWQQYDRPQPFFATPQEALFKAIPEFPEIQLHVISCWQKPMAAPEKLAANIWFHGLLVPKIGWLRTAYQGCIRAVRRKVRELKPDIVHGQGTERECALTAALSGFPNVVTVHGNMAAVARVSRAPIGSFLWCAARLESFALKRTDGVLCNSAHTERQVKSRAHRSWRVPNPLRPAFFSPLPEYTTRPKCALVNVGTISELKQQQELLQLAHAWHRKGLNFELSFLGVAPPQNAYSREFVQEIRLAEQAGYARYLGFKSPDELVQIFDRSDAIIHVPREEAFGLAVAEGLARNLKLFGFGVGGIVDVAEPPVEAQLFPSNDWNSLTTAIEHWIRQGYPRSQNPAELMRKRYHPTVIARRLIEIYAELLSSRP